MAPTVCVESREHPKPVQLQRLAEPVCVKKGGFPSGFPPEKLESGCWGCDLSWKMIKHTVLRCFFIFLSACLRRYTKHDELGAKLSSSSRKIMRSVSKPLLSDCFSRMPRAKQMRGAPKGSASMAWVWVKIKGPADFNPCYVLGIF